MRTAKNKLVIWNPIFILLAILPIAIINVKAAHVYLPFTALNLILVAWCCYRLFPFRYEPISTNTITYLFIYIFFGLSPLIQFSEGVVLWRGGPLTGPDYTYTTVMIIIGIVVYELTYYLTNKFFPALPPEKQKQPRKAIGYRIWVAILISIISAAITYLAFKDSPWLLFYRFLSKKESVLFVAFNNTTLNLLFSILIRPIPLLVLIYYNIVRRKFTLFSLLMIVLILVTNFPLSLARFYVAGLYLPLILSYWPGMLRRPLTVKALFFIGILYIFPFLNQGRTVTNYSEIQFSLDLNYDMFLEGHFDAFQNGARVMCEDFVTYGKQFLAVIFFWVPRSIWPDKPIGSGIEIAHHFGLEFDLLSLNLWAEGWINFGIIGLVLFLMVYGFINARLDRCYWDGKPSNTFKAIYYIYLGLIFFILRGDLNSGVAYSLGLYTLAWTCNKLLVKYRRR